MLAKMLLVADVGLNGVLGDIPFAPISYASIVAFVIFSIFKGWLVTRERHEDVKNQRDKFEEALRVSEQARFEQALTMSKMVDSLTAVEHFMSEFKRTVAEAPHEEERR